MDIENRSYLTDSELQELLAVAEKSPPSQRFLAEIVPFSGLSAAEFSHLRETWIDWGDEGEPVSISIPATMACTTIRCRKNFWDCIEDQRLCVRCRQSDIDGRSVSRKKRTVNITEQRAIDSLKQIFGIYDQMPISGVGEACQKLRGKVHFGDQINYGYLVRTRTRLLAENGLPLDQICQEMGLPPAKKLGGFQTRHLSAVRAAETNYSVNARPRMIYEYLQQYGPATNRDIREYLNTGKASTTRMLQSLKEYGLVEYVSRDKEQFNAKQYSACSEEFVVPCSVCERVFDSIQGVKIHESVHNQE
jgi:hypothetical protein